MSCRKRRRKKGDAVTTKVPGVKGIEKRNKALKPNAYAKSAELKGKECESSKLQANPINLFMRKDYHGSDREGEKK